MKIGEGECDFIYFPSKLHPPLPSSLPSVHTAPRQKWREHVIPVMSGQTAVAV